jgi:hypothetical protein
MPFLQSRQRSSLDESILILRRACLFQGNPARVASCFLLKIHAFRQVIAFFSRKIHAFRQVIAFFSRKIHAFRQVIMLSEWAAKHQILFEKF